MNTNLKLPKSQKFCNGVLNVFLPNLKIFSKAITDNSHFEGWIFRGQRNPCWELKSTWQRNNPGKTFSFGTQQLERFKKYSRGILKHDYYSIVDDDEIWAIGQHHGLMTPLLDWTMSPYVALFFAFEKEKHIVEENNLEIDVETKELLKENGNDIKDFRAVYFLDANKINGLFYKTIGKILSEITKEQSNVLEQAKLNFGDPDPDRAIGKFVELVLKKEKFNRTNPEWNFRASYLKAQIEAVKIFNPSSGENKRLINQGGLFTKTYSEKSIDQIIKNKFNEEDYLIKAFIPNDERANILKHLDSMNINHLSLFPDITGAAKYTNYKKETFYNAEEDLLRQLI